MLSTASSGRLLLVLALLCVSVLAEVAPAGAQGLAVGTVTDLVGEAAVTGTARARPNRLPSAPSCSRATASTPRPARGCGSPCGTARS
jgi:hypothetical protein